MSRRKDVGAQFAESLNLGVMKEHLEDLQELVAYLERHPEPAYFRIPLVNSMILAQQQAIEGMRRKIDEMKATGESPLLGRRFDEAFALASELHCLQKRKGAPVPYISHLMAVAGIVLEANGHYPMGNIEDVAIGALLHDAIEDQGHKIGLDEIKERFGETVHRIVLECSDAIVTTEGEKKPPWKKRKQDYIAKVASKSNETLLVSCADKIHNARTTLFDFDRIGDEIWGRFNGGKDGTVWYYESLVAEFEKAWPENPLLPDLQVLSQRLRAVADST